MFTFERAVLKAGVPEPVEYRTEVRFQDVDAAGFVFFARVLDYFHDAYVAWLGVLGQPLNQVLAEQRWAAPLKHASADYLRPLRFGDQITVEIGPVRLEDSELTVGYRLCCGDGLHCVGQTVHVFVSPSTFKRVPPPAELQARLHKAQGSG